MGKQGRERGLYYSLFIMEIPGLRIRYSVAGHKIEVFYSTPGSESGKIKGLQVRKPSKNHGNPFWK